MSTSEPIVFYDIASGPPVRCFAPNPWKTRYALNFKRVAYRTERVELPDVTATRKSLGVPPVRFWPDGSEFHTLPVISDPSTGSLVGDSFDIALYLDEKYPSSPSSSSPSSASDPSVRGQLFPPGTVGIYAAFNTHVDAVFTPAVQLGVQDMPFNPANADVAKAEFMRRAGVDTWDQMLLVGDEARRPALEAFRTRLEGLGAAYARTAREGPFLNGAQVSYGDFIVGGWVAMFRIVVPEWDEVAGWYDGFLGKLDETLRPWAQDEL